MKVISTSTSKTDGTVWATIDPKSLSQELQMAYEAYREANAMAAELRQAFEQQFRSEADRDGIRFGYNFGKLSVAMGEPKSKAKAQPKMSLAEFMASQANGGWSR